jgi:hypothetical protein
MFFSVNRRNPAILHKQIDMLKHTVIIIAGYQISDILYQKTHWF